MKKKILFINPFLIQGGVEHSLITALRNLDPEKYEITLFLYIEKLDLLPEVPDYVETVVAEDHRRYYRYPKPLLLLARSRFARARGKISKADALETELNEYIHEQKVNFAVQGPLKGRRFDIVISFSLHIGTEMALTVPAERHIVFMRSSNPDYHREIAERTFDRYDAIVAVGEGTQKVYQDEYPQYKDKILRLDNYVDADEIRRKAAAEELSFPSNMTIVCSCGRFSKEKGFDLAVEAAAILRDAGYTFIWYFVGDGPERSALEEKIAKYGLQNEMVITGLRENPFPYLLGCDVYVQPSYEESFGRTIKEAELLQKPIVSTRTVGAVDVLRNGELGLLAEITANDLAKQIARMLNDPDLRATFSDRCAMVDNRKEKEEHIRKWSELLE